MNRTKITICALLLSLTCISGFANVQTQPQAPAPLKLVFFYSPTCEMCHNVENALPEILAPWADKVIVERLNIEDANNLEKLLLYEKHYNAQISAPPAIFVGRQYLTGEKDVIDRLPDVIFQELTSGSTTFLPQPKQAVAPSAQQQPHSEIVTRFKNFSVTAVMAAGLLDGINPCAFTTIIFLLSMLAKLGKNKRQLAVVGAGFTFAVFMTYFLLGLGFFGTVKAFSVSHGLSNIITIIIACLTFALGIWSFVDFVRYLKTASVKSVTLGLPKSVNEKIHKVIRTGFNTRNLLIGSIGVGFLVSILESVCTGQIYLPTIMFIIRTPDLKATAIWYLLLYNLMFILPLVIILAIAYFGVKSQRLANFLRDHLAALKLAMAILFIGLTILLVATL